MISKIKQLSSTRIASLFLFISMFGLLAVPAFAQEFTQGYATTETLLRGEIVGINAEQENQVSSINSDNNEDLLGVVVRSNDSAVTLTEDTTGVFVATTGRFEVLVSDIRGNISSGDNITTSPVTGIGQKAGPTEGQILGKMLETIDFNDTSRVLSQTTVTNDNGETLTVNIARGLAEINIGPNPDLASEASAPEFLVKFSETIAGKPVSAIRIYAGLIIIIIAGAISGSLLYSSVKTSIISIGRNPLSKNSVLTGLAQVVVISVIIFISGLVAVYLLLKI